jgi:hypothetical protein
MELAAIPRSDTLLFKLLRGREYAVLHPKDPIGRVVAHRRPGLPAGLKGVLG